jgi:3-methyl-2-oxobutanoate hydroxymethyltransferase
LRAAFKAMRAGGDAVYCAAGMGIVRRLREEGISVCGHSCLIRSQATWTGGFNAVGKTRDTSYAGVESGQGAGRSRFLFRRN